MASISAVTFNSGSTITGTTQVGDLAIGSTPQDYTLGPGGLRWWASADFDSGYIIAHVNPNANQPNQEGVSGVKVGFWRTSFTDESFIQKAEYVAKRYHTPETFTSATQANEWFFENGYWTSYSGNTPSVSSTPTPTVTATNTVTPTPTPSVTETPSATTTPTPTPSVTPEPVTGYSFNLIALPYNFPSSGNTIMNSSSGSTGTTEVNLLSTSAKGIYWNSIDSDGIDRTNYFSQFTGQSITITLSQTGSTAIYSGDTDSLKFWSANAGTPPGVPGTGFVFGTGIGVPPTNTPSGTAVLIQSASTQWNFGIPVYISVVVNGLVTPTPTPSVTPTLTETPSITPTSTTTPTPSSTPGAPITSNLVLYYDPSNPSSYSGTGTVINDLSGNGLNGTMSNITFSDPYFSYNGSSSQVSIADNALLEPGSGDWSIEFWVNYTTFGSSMILIAKTDGGNSQDWGYGLRTSGIGSVFMEIGNGTSSLQSSSTGLTINTWYQVVGVWTNVATNSFALYVNGNLVGSNSHSYTSVKNTTSPLYIGSFNGGQFSQWLNGRMGVVRLYNKSLSGVEILQNFNADKSKYGL